MMFVLLPFFASIFVLYKTSAKCTRQKHKQIKINIFNITL